MADVCWQGANIGEAVLGIQGVLAYCRDKLAGVLLTSEHWRPAAATQTVYPSKADQISDETAR